MSTLAGVFSVIHTSPGANRFTFDWYPQIGTTIAIGGEMALQTGTWTANIGGKLRSL